MGARNSLFELRPQVYVSKSVSLKSKVCKRIQINKISIKLPRISSHNDDNDNNNSHCRNLYDISNNNNISNDNNINLHNTNASVFTCDEIQNYFNSILQTHELPSLARSNSIHSKHGIMHNVRLIAINGLPPPPPYIPFSQKSILEIFWQDPV